MSTFLLEERKRLGLTQVDIAKAISVSKGTYIRWEGGSPIPSDKLARLSDEGFDVYYILKGIRSPTPLNALTHTDINLGHENQLIAVTQYDLAASAGNGALVVAEQPVARFELSKLWLQQHNLHNKKLTVVPVRGDSMEATLFDGDLTLVSLVQNVADAREGIFVLRFDDEIFVKRIQYDFKSKGYQVISDNHAYADFFVEASDIAQNRFMVLGRVERVLQRTRKG